MFIVQDLTEKAGYEYWVLRKCLSAIEKHAGVSSDVTVSFCKDGTKEHIMQMYSEFGSEKRVQVIENLSPLLFVSSYKMIDMYIEWLLNYASTPPMIWVSDHEVLLALYEKLRLKSYYIIHGFWGRNVNGDLQFNYTDKGTLDQDEIGFNDVINLAELIVINNQIGAEHIETSFRYLSDQLIILHQSHSFGIDKPRFYEVILEAEDESTIELQPIREYLKKDFMNHPVSFKLTVRTPSKELIFTNKDLSGKIA